MPKFTMFPKNDSIEVPKELYKDLLKEQLHYITLSSSKLLKDFKELSSEDIVIRFLRYQRLIDLFHNNLNIYFSEEQSKQRN